MEFHSLPGLHGHHNHADTLNFHSDEEHSLDRFEFVFSGVVKISCMTMQCD